MVRGTAVVVVVLGAVPAAVLAQAPSGGQFQVNTYTTGRQRYPSAAADARGNFVVVWWSNPEYPELAQVRGQRYEASGARRGAEFRVNTYTTFGEGDTALASDARGNFVVAWTSAAQDGSGSGIFAQRYDAAGAARGAQFQVNAYTTGDQRSPSLAIDGAGNFIVVWRGPLDGGPPGVFGQRFDSGGSRLGAELAILTVNPTNSSIVPEVASAADGDFVVAWSAADIHFNGVFARRFGASGMPRGASFQVNTTTFGDQGEVALASDPAGNFVVAWRNAPIPFGNGIFARRYDADGVAQGGEFQVNTRIEEYPVAPAVAMDATGGFVVAWIGATLPPGDPDDVRVRRFDASGTPRGAELSASVDQQSTRGSALAIDSAGNFTVVWRDYADVFGRRFGGLHTEGLDVDSAGNHVLEPGEAVDVRPTWVNWTGAPQAFTGTLSNLTGPAGPAYSITDANGSYGTVPSGLAASCIDCYAASVSAPTTRPATHWDASVVESLAPDVQGQRKTWVLHVGESFTDVPRTSGFYRFIETLLHQGVTGGCAGDSYCPSASTTREQMAVFVLLAKEGTGYVPPACAPPNVFGDVAETSPFCRFIEELAGRGVVSGCGGGNYCAADPVTREQMAVFVLRTLDSALSPPACTTPVFADVPASSPFCRWVEELARRGVVSGCGGGNYCPGAPVTREQMGVFLGVTFGLTLYGP